MRNPTRSALMAGLVFLSASSAALAQEAPVLQGRATVIADTLMWQRSGLAKLETTDAGADVRSSEYLQAKAEYGRLRASPEFAALVKRIAVERGERANVALN